jgi:putative transposase
MRRPRPQPVPVRRKASDFAIRELIDCSDGRCLRVIDVLHASDELVVFDVEAKDAQPRCISHEEADELLEALRWRPRESTRVNAANEDAISIVVGTEDDPYGDERWELFSKYGKTPGLYDKRTRGAALEFIAGRCKRSVKHVRETLKLAWRGGMTPESLRSQVRNRGRRCVDGKPRGRKPTKADYNRYAWPDKKFRTRVLNFAVSVYKKRTLDDTYTQVRKRFFTRNQGNVSEDLPLGERPTKRQLQVLLDKALTPEEKSIRKFGKHQHELQFDPRVGSVHDACRGPGDVYEIDASQVDVWLLSREKGKVRHVIGKATMYLVVDRYSRLIVGFYVSLDPPSWAGAMRAFLSIFEDKEALCKRHGVKYDPKDWIAQGLMPNRLFADRGSEFTGKNSDLVARNLQVIVTNAKSRWAAAKGTVECSFKLVHVELKRDTIGHDPAYNRRVRRAAKTYKSAKLTILTLRRRLLKAILAHNNRPHKNYQLPPEDIRDGHSPVPRDIYARGLKKYGRPSFFEEREVLRSLLCFSAAPPRGEKTNKSPDRLETGGAVRKDGIRFGGATYESQAIRRAGWLLRAKQGDAFRVHVRHDLGLVDYIYVIDPSDPSIEHRLELATDFKNLAGYTRYEVLNLFDLRAENDFWDQEKEESARVRRAEDFENEESEPINKVIKNNKMPETRAKEKRIDRSESRAMPATQADIEEQSSQPKAEASSSSPQQAPSTLPVSTAGAGLMNSVLNRLLRNLKKNP